MSVALRPAASPSHTPSPELQGPVPGSLSTLLAWFPRPLVPGSPNSQSGKRKACVVPWHLGPLVAYYRLEGRVAQRESTRFTPGRPQVQPLPRPPGARASHDQGDIVPLRRSRDAALLSRLACQGRIGVAATDGRGFNACPS